MDVLDRMRLITIDDDLDNAQLEHSRAALETAIAAERRPHAHRARVLRIGIVAASIAGVAAVALVVSTWQPRPSRPIAETHAPAETVEPDPTATTAPLTAVVVLDRAAMMAPASVGSTIAGARYLRIDTQTEQLVLYGADAKYGPFNATRAEATAGWTVAGSYTTYIPADRSREWVSVFHPAHTLVSTFGADAQALYASWIAGVPDEEIVIRTMGGMGDAPSSDLFPMFGSDAYYAKMPRDPRALYNWYSAKASYDSVFRLVVQDLEVNAAPADLRAAMFRALGFAPGVTIVGTDGTVVTLGFDWEVLGEKRRETISVDSATGLVTASTVTVGSGSAVVPQSVPTFRTITTTSATDTAP